MSVPLHSYLTYEDGSKFILSDSRDKCQRISKNDLLVLAYYPSFSEFRKRIGEYLRTKRFNLDMRNYPLTEAS